MSRSTLGIALALGVLGCGSPKPIVAANDRDPLQAHVAELREQVQRLQNQVENLQIEISEDEFTEMTIDGVRWDDELLGALEAGEVPKLLCHVHEWRGFKKMLRFTRKVDHTFLLESGGQPPIHGYTGEGGISNDDGSIRYVMMILSAQPTRGVAYSLRPQNGREGYRWRVADGVAVVGR